MYSASKYLTSFFLCLGSLAATGAPLLRVCADPNNLPYSDQQQQGFENQLATMIANDLSMQVSYTMVSTTRLLFSQDARCWQV